MSGKKADGVLHSLEMGILSDKHRFCQQAQLHACDLNVGSIPDYWENLAFRLVRWLLVDWLDIMENVLLEMVLLIHQSR